MRALDVITVLAAGGLTGVLMERSRHALGRRTSTLTATPALAVLVCGAALPAAARLATLGTHAEDVASGLRLVALVASIAIVWRGAGRVAASEPGR